MSFEIKVYIGSVLRVLGSGVKDRAKSLELAFPDTGKLSCQPSKHGRPGGIIGTQTSSRIAAQLQRCATSEAYRLQNQIHAKQVISVYPSRSPRGAREPGTRPGVRNLRGFRVLALRFGDSTLCCSPRLAVIPGCMCKHEGALLMDSSSPGF